MKDRAFFFSTYIPNRNNFQSSIIPNCGVLMKRCSSLSELFVAVHSPRFY